MQGIGKILCFFKRLGSVNPNFIHAEIISFKVWKCNASNWGAGHIYEKTEIIIDNKAPFRYLDDYCSVQVKPQYLSLQLRPIHDSQSLILSLWKKQLLVTHWQLRAHAKYSNGDRRHCHYLGSVFH